MLQVHRCLIETWKAETQQMQTELSEQIEFHFDCPFISIVQKSSYILDGLVQLR